MDGTELSIKDKSHPCVSQPDHSGSIQQVDTEAPASKEPAPPVTSPQREREFAGKFRFQRRDSVTDYDSDDEFCCYGDEDFFDQTDLEHDGEDVEISYGKQEDQIEGAEDADLPGYDEPDDNRTPGDAFPWKDVGVVDLEAASQWDFMTLTKRCKFVVREISERTVSLVKKLRAAEEFREKVELECGVSKEDADAIFLNLSQVLRLQVALLGDLRQELLKRPARPRIGHVFRRFAPFFKLHEDLSCKSRACRASIQRLSDTNDSFRRAHQRFNKTGHRFGLGDMLYEPYKYLTDCKEQFRRYLRLNVIQEDYHDSKVALRLMEDVLDTINDDSMRYYNQNTRMLEIRPIFHSQGIEIMKAHRMLLHEGKMNLISPQTGLPISCEVFLFNDVLMLCTPVLAQAWLSSVRILGMEATDVIREGDDIIVVYSPEKVVELQIGRGNVIRWYQALSQVVIPPSFDVTQSCRTVGYQLGSRAPRFVLANTVTSCHVCDKKFRRRSKESAHCHTCGQVACLGCSATKMALPYRRDYEPRRVCDECCRYMKIQVT